MENISLKDSTDLLIDGASFFPRIFDELTHAKHNIYIENYLVEDGNLWAVFIMLLKGAADKGVQVKCIFDGFGASDVYHDLVHLNTHPNIEVKYFNPINFLKLGAKSLRRTHIKLFVVDERVAFTGGTGLTDKFYDPMSQVSSWSEAMVRVEGESMQYVCSLFLWRFYSIQSTTQRSLLLSRPNEFIPGRELEGWLYAHHFTTHWIKRALYRQLAKAEKRIWINSAYFFPTRKTLRYLKKKAMAGVDVRLLLPGVTDVLVMKYLARGRYKKLLSAGVSIHELNGRFIHSKIVLVDDWATIGSFNLDILSFRLNHELNYATYDLALVKQLESFFLSNLHSANEVNPSAWTNRFFISKLIERAVYKCALLLEKLLK
jgi:phosphatidylserine/phosphatidylglycerophosphate/cardiolipin synthase-like enzyme